MGLEIFSESSSQNKYVILAHILWSSSEHVIKLALMISNWVLQRRVINLWKTNEFFHGVHSMQQKN